GQPPLNSAFSVPFSLTRKRNIKFFPKKNMFAVLSLLSKNFLQAKIERTNHSIEQPVMYFLSSDKKYQKADLGVFP
ncbi:MAG: hypothetical protein IJW97_00915, partial [Clostridia bacterium]|nr:hypothetical protein [Clostridia bacterium]